MRMVSFGIMIIIILQWLIVALLTMLLLITKLLEMFGMNKLLKELAIATVAAILIGFPFIIYFWRM